MGGTLRWQQRRKSCPAQHYGSMLKSSTSVMSKSSVTVRPIVKVMVVSTSVKQTVKDIRFIITAGTPGYSTRKGSSATSSSNSLRVRVHSDRIVGVGASTPSQIGRGTSGGQRTRYSSRV